METRIVLIVLLIIVLVILARCIRVVQQSKAYVIERLGAFHTVWSVGLHFKIPFIDRVQRVVSLKEQVADFPPQPVITKDNVTIQIDTVLYFQITDPKLYAYGVENPMSAIENLTATTLRNIIGELELDQSLTSRDIINARMRSILDEATASCIYTQKGNKKIRKPQAANQTALIFDRRAAARLLSINSIRRLCWS